MFWRLPFNPAPPRGITPVPPSAAHRDDLRRTLAGQRAALRQPVPQAAHAIVVFGAPADADGRPKPPLEARLRRALAALEADPSAVAVVSGGAVKGGRESAAMRRWLQGHGIAPSRIVEEGAARFTLENAELAAALVKNTGASKVTLVTERFHMPRSSALMQGALRGLGVDAELTLAAAPDAVANPARDRGEAGKRARDLDSQSHLHSMARAQATVTAAAGPAPRLEWWA